MVPCPICGVKKMARPPMPYSMSSLELVVGARGRRRQGSRFTSLSVARRSPVTCWLNSKGAGAGTVPDMPYKCQSCGRRYKQVSALMQHQQYG